MTEGEELLPINSSSLNANSIFTAANGGETEGLNEVIITRDIMVLIRSSYSVEILLLGLQIV